jgi:hypothetical protein
MIDLIVVWTVLLLALIALAMGRVGNGGALVLSYFLTLSLIHLPGALIYADPQAAGDNREQTLVGFTLTIIGMTAFVAGAVLARMSGKQVPAEHDSAALSKLAPQTWMLIWAGAFSYFFLMPRAANIPSGTALVSSLGSLLVIGFWLRFYTASLTRNRWRTLSTLMLLPALPASTLATGGFIGYGISWMLSGVAFFFSVSKRRLVLCLASPFVGIVGLSFAASYLASRVIVRTAIAYDQGFSVILAGIGGMFSNFQLLDLSSPLLTAAVDARLNQNYLDGYAAERYLTGSVGLAYGSTIQLWSLIPRAIWPGKPAVGGGGDFVSQFTGIPFDANTSVGIGQVMEFYMNFAMPGLIIGFFLLGFILMRLDIGIMRALKGGDMRSLLLCAMPGLTLIQPEGNLQEIIVAAVAAVVTSRLLTGWGFFGSSVPERMASAIGEPAE